MLSSNSQERLYNLISKHCSDGKLCIEILSYVETACSNRSLDFDKVAEEVSNAIERTPDIRYIAAFVKGVVTRIDDSRFAKGKSVNYSPSTQPLINDMRNKGIHINENDSAHIFVIWDTLVNECKIPLDVASDINHKVLDFMKPEQEFKDYLSLLKRAKTLAPYNIDWEKIEKCAETFIKEWNETLDAMPSEVLLEWKN